MATSRTSLSDIEFLARSPHRVGVLDALAEGPCDRDDLRSATGASRPTIGRILSDFETAYAWNRILTEHAPVLNIGVDTTTAWTLEPAGEGLHASRRIETSYAKKGR